MLFVFKQRASKALGSGFSPGLQGWRLRNDHGLPIPIPGASVDMECFLAIG